VSRVLSTSRALNTHEALLDDLRRAGHQVDVRDGVTPDATTMAELVSPYHALIVGLEPVDAAVIAAAPLLRVVARPGAGYDRVDVAAATEAGVAVTITPGVNKDSVADHTMALLLASVRQISSLATVVAAGGWPRATGMELRGATLGLLGLGAIGRAVAERARGFGLEVIATDPFADRAVAARLQVQLVGLHELMSRSDILSLHAPVTGETRRLVDARFLEQVKPGAVLINTARGELLDEAAVASAVASGRLSAVAVDVLATEPPTSSPLIGLPGVVVTPHIAAYTHQALRRMAEMAVRSVLDVLADRKPHGLVDPAVWSHRRSTGGVRARFGQADT
jgi:D-3-phosphoglycerate dehydrogenase / 2-oxoglutarate reductase